MRRKWLSPEEAGSKERGNGLPPLPGFHREAQLFVSTFEAAMGPPLGLGNQRI